jgi:hypothetical protein
VEWGQWSRHEKAVPFLIRSIRWAPNQNHGGPNRVHFLRQCAAEGGRKSENSKYEKKHRTTDRYGLLYGVLFVISAKNHINLAAH